MTDVAQHILSNSLNEACERFGLKAAILVCFEDGIRTIMPIGHTLELCNAAERLAGQLNEAWSAIDYDEQSGPHIDDLDDYPTPPIPRILH